MAKTWILNDFIVSSIQTTLITTISFTSKNTQFTRFSIQEDGRSVLLDYVKSDSTSTRAYYMEADTHYWIDDDYKTVVFETEPTGELLSWLQTNGTPVAEASLITKIQVGSTNYDINASQLDGTADAGIIKEEQNYSVSVSSSDITLSNTTSGSIDFDTSEIDITATTATVNNSQIQTETGIDTKLANTFRTSVSGNKVVFSIGKLASKNWLFNETLSAVPGITSIALVINFTSAGENYAEIDWYSSKVDYCDEDGLCVEVYDVDLYSGWMNDSLRTVRFSTIPTGDLLTFLQANATPIS